MGLLSQVFSGRKQKAPPTVFPPIPKDINPKEPLDVAAYWFQLNEFSAALQYLEKSALQADPVGLFLAGMAHSHGWGCKRNEKLGLQYYRSAAEATVAATQIGTIVLNTSTDSLSESVDYIAENPYPTVTIDKESTPSPSQHLEQKADTEVSTVITTTAIVGSEIHVGPHSEMLSRVVLANTPSPLSQFHAMLSLTLHEIGIAYCFGWGIRRSKSKGFEFIRIAAELGDPDAQQHLGFLYLHGLGVKRDINMAAHWYRVYEKATLMSLFEAWIWLDENNSHEINLRIANKKPTAPETLISQALNLIHQSPIIPIHLDKSAIKL